MLHTEKKEKVEIPAVNINININAIKADDAAKLEHLQKQRKKANKQRKSYWQKRIDEHFGLK